jgi:hypothetical protein
MAAETDWNRLLTLEKDTELAQNAHFGLAAVYRKLGKHADAECEMKAFEDLKDEMKYEAWLCAHRESTPSNTSTIQGAGTHIKRGLYRPFMLEG